MKTYYVYIMTNRTHGTLYIDVTSDLVKRVYEHKNGLVDGFTKRHELKRLVYYEMTQAVHLALQREKNLKHWMRQWKIELIESMNPQWRDLAEELGFEADPRVKSEDDSTENKGSHV